MPDNLNPPRCKDESAMLRLIADSIPAMLAYFDADSSVCEFANDGYAGHFGLTAQSIVGRPASEIMGEVAWARIQPLLQSLQAPGAPPARHTHQSRLPTGESQFIETALHPHIDEGRLKGLLVLMSDVTRQHSLTRQMLDSEERMRKFAALTTEALVLHRDGVILDGNSALARLTGYTIDELRGTPVLDHVAPEFRLRALQYMRGDREDHYELELLHKSGRIIPVEAEAKTMPEGSQEYRVVALRDMTANIQACQHMDFLAQHDMLTRLPNRRHLGELLHKALTQAEAQQSRLAVLSLDLDQFQAVNDSLNHRAGDLLLCEMAQRLRNALRPQDLVARIGGDDFVVILTGNPSLLDTEDMAAQLHSAVEAPYQVEGTQLVLSLSVGIAMYPKDGGSPEALLSNAEAAMHMAKGRGRSFTQFYTPVLEGRATRLLMQEQMLRQSVDQGEFELHYQPQIHMRTGKLTGFEALVRWKHPHRGLVSPDEFIGFAENRGLIAAVDRWVLQQACRQAKAWQGEGWPPVPMAVNLSAQEFRQRDVVREVTEALQETGLDARLLHIELTESTLMLSSGQMPETLHALKALGVGLAIDDFGTGYSSLAYLRKHPIDQLKIDRSFVCDLPHSADAAAIVSAIVQMGQSLNLDIVAEGVENLSQQMLLRDMGCAMMQGFLVSAPLPARQARQWMSQHRHLLPGQ